MAQNESFYLDLLENLSDGVYFADLNRHVLYWNTAAERITGFRRKEVLGNRCMDNILRHVDAEGNLLCLQGCPLEAVTMDGQVHEAEMFLHHKEGHRVPVMVRASPIRDGEGKIIGAVEIFNNNSSKLQVEERLAEMERLALADTLTGLSNRRHMEIHLRARLEELRRFGWPCGALFMDIDHFKSINDGYGHDVGDRVLQMVGRTLRSNARSFEQIGRWGGEEFVIVVAAEGLDRLRGIGERFRILVENSFLPEPERLGVTISIGCAEGKAEDTLESLIARADEKLYQAKQSGRNRVCI